jgi:hypothetical protein
MGDGRLPLAPQEQEAVLREIASVLLAEEGEFVPDWEIVGPQIAAEIGRQSGQLLDDARIDYDAYERLRARAVRAYGRADPIVCGLSGVLAGYLFLVIAGPELLPLAAANPGLGLTPWIIAVLAVALGVRWSLARGRAGLTGSAYGAYQRWTDVLRDQVLRPFVVEKRNDEVRNPRLFDTSIGEKSPPRLVEGSEPRRLVVTDAMNQVSSTARNVYSGSLGVSGPRGVGKSTILQFFGADAGGSGDLRLVVAAPVDYEPREFIIRPEGFRIPEMPAKGAAVAVDVPGGYTKRDICPHRTAGWVRAFSETRRVWSSGNPSFLDTVISTVISRSTPSGAARCWMTSWYSRLLIALLPRCPCDRSQWALLDGFHSLVVHRRRHLNGPPSGDLP